MRKNMSYFMGVVIATLSLVPVGFFALFVFALLQAFFMQQGSPPAAVEEFIYVIMVGLAFWLAIYAGVLGYRHFNDDYNKNIIMGANTPSKRFVNRFIWTVVAIIVCYLVVLVFSK